MAVLELGKDFNRIENFVLLINKNFDLIDYFSQQECAFIAQQIADEKQIVHINKYENQAYVVVVPEKKYLWQVTEILRRKGVDVLKSLNGLKQQSIQVVNKTENKELGFAFLEGLYLSTYQFIHYHKDSLKKAHSLSSIFYFGELSETELSESFNLWQAVFQTKSLINEPVISLPSVQFVNEIKTIASKTGFSANIHSKEWLEEQGMGGILAVNKGSIDPPFFCILEWKPDNAENKKPIVLVGKGVMYDTGGLSLKTSPGMETMKADMSGASAVLGVVTALAANKVPKHIIALLPITDNRPTGNAYAPGDIIKMHDGTFVEVLNTDAEGRMLLADALSYAKLFEPEIVVNIATLTGSANAAVGENAAVVMGTASQDQITALVDCGYTTHERLVQFPLWDDYTEYIKSDIADLKNVGGPLAGAITAGKFLEHFTTYPWIHIDIAGSAYHPKGADYRGKGATGMGVRLLYSYIKTL